MFLRLEDLLLAIDHPNSVAPPQQVAAGKGTFLGKANKQRDQEERLAGGKTKKLGKRAGGAARGGVVEGFRPVDVSGGLLYASTVYQHMSLCCYVAVQTLQPGAPADAGRI